MESRHVCLQRIPIICCCVDGTHLAAETRLPSATRLRLETSILNRTRLQLKATCCILACIWTGHSMLTQDSRPSLRTGQIAGFAANRAEGSSSQNTASQSITDWAQKPTTSQECIMLKNAWPLFCTASAEHTASPASLSMPPLPPPIKTVAPAAHV